MTVDFDGLVARLTQPLPGYLGRGFLESLGADLAAARDTDGARFARELEPAIAAVEWPDPLPLEGVDAVVAWETIRPGARYSLAFGGPQPGDLFEQLVATTAADRIVALGFVGSAEEGTALTDALFEALVACESLTGLSQLTFRGALYRGGPSVLEGSGLHALAGSSHAARLKSLWVEELAAPRGALVEFLGAWRALTWLKLVRLELTADDLGTLVDRRAWPELATLEISGCNIGDAGASHIAAAGWKLMGLYLQRTGLEGPGVEALAGSEHLSGLTTLELPNNWLRDAGAAAIAGADWKLTELNLSNCQIRDGGFIALADAPFIGQLSSLNMGRNSPWESGVEAMERSPLNPLLAEDIRYDFEG